MRPLWILEIAILIIASYVIFISIFNKQHRFITIVLLTSFWAIFFNLSWAYLFHRTFQTYVNTFIQPREVHITLGGELPPLPLPPATAFRFRFSEEGAKYYSRLSIGEVIEFYNQQVTGVKVLSRESEDQGIRLLLIYQETAYSILLTSTGRSDTDILVKSIS